MVDANYWREVLGAGAVVAVVVGLIFFAREVFMAIVQEVILTRAMRESEDDRKDKK